MWRGGGGRVEILLTGNLLLTGNFSDREAIEKGTIDKIYQLMFLNASSRTTWKIGRLGTDFNKHISVTFITKLAQTWVSTASFTFLFVLLIRLSFSFGRFGHFSPSFTNFIK